MKKAIVFLILLPILVYPQEIFQKTISYSNALTIRDMVRLPENGYLGCGYLKASIPDSSYAFIIRLDSLMEVQWCKSVNMYAFDYYRCISPLSDGNFLAGGISHSDFSEYYGASLYKIDPSGNILWHKIYTANYDDATIGAFEQADQTRVLIIRHGVNGQPTKVIKTDNSGNTILGKFNLSTSNVPPGIFGDIAISDGSGNYYIGGTVLSGTTEKYVYFICKINDSAPIWYNEYDFGRNTSSEANIKVLSDGNVAVTGYVADESLPSKYSLVVMIVDPADGSVIWAKEIKDSEGNNPFGGGILALANSEMLVYGGASNPDGSRAFAAKFSADGNIEWAREYGTDDNYGFSRAFESGSNLFSFAGVAVLNEGPYLVQTDSNGSSPCDTFIPDLLSSDLTVTLYPQDVITGDFNVEPAEVPYIENAMSLTENTLCSGTISVDELPGSFRISIYPNPAGEYISVELNDRPKTAHHIEICNINGKLISSREMTDQHVLINTPFAPGIYLLTIRNKVNQATYRQKFVVY